MTSKIDIQNISQENIFEQVPFGIAVSYNCNSLNEGEKSHAIINRVYEEITGRNKDEMIQLGWAKITHPDDLQKNLYLYRELEKGNINNYSMEKRFIKPDGSVVWVDMTVAKLKFGKIKKYNHISIVHDITERKLMEKALVESERSKAMLLSNLPGLAYRCYYDKYWTMQFVSEGCYELTGYKPDSLINNKELSFNDLISPKYRNKLWKRWTNILQKKAPFISEYEIITAKGNKKWVLEMGQGIYDEQGNVTALEGIIVDISKRKEYENKLKYINEHYEHTGLYNENHFINLMSTKSVKSINCNRAILLINYKKISSVGLIYGLNFSKKIIKEVSRKLNKLMDKQKTLFQLSNDKFALYIRDYEDKSQLIDLCLSIFDITKEVQILNNIGCSIGILEIDEQNWDAENIIRNVSVASERTNDNIAFDYCFYDEELKLKVTRENHIRNELLRIATDENDDSINLQYQPIMNLKTMKISGFEALARIYSKTLGLVSPEEFIPIAEEMLLIVPIGNKIMQIACEFIRKLEKDCDDITVSVNVSGIQLLSENFINELIGLIKEYEINTKHLGIEITESVFLDGFEIINEKLYILKQMGIEILIDDFGTGYSSFYRESEMNVSAIKIDKYFTDKLIKRNPNNVITGDIISIAHKLGYLVVAEGVELEEQRQFLIKNNCDYIQGYLIGQPLDEEDALKMLGINGQET